MRTEGPLDTNVGPRCHMVAFYINALATNPLREQSMIHICRESKWRSVTFALLKASQKWCSLLEWCLGARASGRRMPQHLFSCQRGCHNISDLLHNTNGALKYKRKACSSFLIWPTLKMIIYTNSTPKMIIMSPFIYPHVILNLNDAVRLMISRFQVKSSQVTIIYISVMTTLGGSSMVMYMTMLMCLVLAE